MELAIRKTARAKQGGGANPVGEVVVICPDGHPWTPAERSLFHIVTIPNGAPAWIMDRLRARALKFHSLPASVNANEASLMGALRTYDGKPVNKLVELGRRAVLASLLDTEAAARAEARNG